MASKAAPLSDPLLREYQVVGGLDTFKDRSFWPRFFSRLVAGLQWSATAIDLTADARAWPELPDERRDRLQKILAAFIVAEDAVAEQLTPFVDPQFVYLQPPPTPATLRRCRSSRRPARWYRDPQAAGR